jgi:enolase
LAKTSGDASLVSHGSSETENTTIADIVVATNAREIKTSSMSRTNDRACQDHQLMRISGQLGDGAILASDIERTFFGKLYNNNIVLSSL